MRIKQIDALRAIAAVLVTFFHLTGSSGLSKTTACYGSYGWLGVQIFFVISGFVLPYSMYRSEYNIKNFGIFLLKRIIRIYPAYLAAIVIGLFLAIVTHRELVPLSVILAHLVFLNNVFGLPGISPVFWTLAIEFQFYLLIGITYPLLAKSNVGSLTFIMIVSLFSIVCKQWTIFYWFPFFALGILIFNKFFTGLSLRIFWLSVALLIVLIVFNYGIPQAIAALFAVLFIVFVKTEKQSFINKILWGIGSISYSLYLVHWELGRVAVNIARRFPVIGDMELIKVFIGLVFSMISAYLLYRFIEKPSIRFSSKFRYKSS